MSKRLVLAVDAVRDTSAGEASGPACYTRARVLAAVRQHQQRRVIKVTFGIPLGAVLLGSVAWAATGQHMTMMVQHVSAVITQNKTEHGTRTSSKAKNPKPSHIEARAQVPEPTEPAHAPQQSPAPIATDATQPAAMPASSTAHKPTQRPLAEAPRIDHDELTERELQLYESAHRAHFIDKNWAVALAAWDEYLRQLPRGRFSIEARYNRALCLVRLGRADAAVRALKPFALGTPGSYRQREAQTLIEQLK
jgi:TolA-binding protein